MSGRNIAVFVDADNVSSAAAKNIFEIVGEFGNPIVRKGKNAADIALVIDAMECLYTKPLDAFCIVSSDSDYTALAADLRAKRISPKSVAALKSIIKAVYHAPAPDIQALVQTLCSQQVIRVAKNGALSLA